MYSTFFLLKTVVNDDFEIDIEMDAMLSLDLPMSGHTGELMLNDEAHFDSIKELQGFLSMAGIRKTLGDNDLDLYKVTTAQKMDRETLGCYLDGLKRNKKDLKEFLNKAKVEKNKVCNESSEQSFINAAINNDINIIKNEVHNYQENPDVIKESFFNCCAKNNTSIIKELMPYYLHIEHEIDKQAKDELFSTLLFNQNFNVCKKLIEKSVSGFCGNQSLLVLIRTNNTDILKLIFEKGSLSAIKNFDVLKEAKKTNNFNIIFLVFKNFTHKDKLTKDETQQIEKILGNDCLIKLKQQLLKENTIERDSDLDDSMSL